MRALRLLALAAVLATATAAARAAEPPAAPAPPPAPGEEAAGADGASLDADLVTAREVAGPIPDDPAAPLWEGIPARTFAAVPQRALRLHDAAANAALAAPGAGPRAVAVRAAFDGKELALALEWADATEDRAAPDSTDGFGDAAALELPLRFGAGQRLPYVGMGDDDHPVALLLARAAAAGATSVREAVAAGFGSVTRADLGGVRARLVHDRARGAWRAVLVRPLAAGGLDLRAGLVPFALAVWDGARHERGGNKALTGWKLLRLPRWPADAAYASELAAARRPGERGDVARGKALVEGVCAACHAVGARRSAPPGVAPDLTDIGAIATPAYLRESITAPSAVIVPTPNPWQHQARAKGADGAGAFPADERFTWWRRDAEGKKVSRMPAFAGLPEPDLEAIVSYLRTLGAAAPGAGRIP